MRNHCSTEIHCVTIYVLYLVATFPSLNYFISVPRLSIEMFKAKRDDQVSYIVVTTNLKLY
jgi:hypothetical protein